MFTLKKDVEKKGKETKKEDKQDQINNKHTGDSEDSGAYRTVQPTERTRRSLPRHKSCSAQG